MKQYTTKYFYLSEKITLIKLLSNLRKLKILSDNEYKKNKQLINSNKNLLLSTTKKVFNYLQKTL